MKCLTKHKILLPKKIKGSCAFKLTSFWGLSYTMNYMKSTQILIVFKQVNKNDIF